MLLVRLGREDLAFQEGFRSGRIARQHTALVQPRSWSAAVSLSLTKVAADRSPVSRRGRRRMDARLPAISCVEQGLRGGAVLCGGLNLTVSATGNQERQPEAVDAAGNRGTRDAAACSAEG